MPAELNPVALIVQARMTSTRLPGKVLSPVLGRPLLVHQFERLKRVRQADVLCLAITTNRTDDPLAALGKEMDVHVYRGPEDDVLARYHGAASQLRARTIVRVTSDCPLIDPAVIDRVITRFKERHPAEAYVSNTVVRTFPRGMDTEVFSFEALAEAHREAVEPAEREHVTPFLIRRPDRYPPGQVLLDPDSHRHRWTVDTPDDLELVRRMLENLLPDRPEFTLEDGLELLRRHPGWAALNAHVEQKPV
jgi:spore coat polysaccharide biosynthesis protein SpsF